MEQPDMSKSNNESKGQNLGLLLEGGGGLPNQAMLAAILGCQEHPVGGDQSRN